MKTLIFDKKISGHHLEYLHHYYRGVVDRNNDDFVFCLEDGFLKQKSQFEWVILKEVGGNVLCIVRRGRIICQSGLYCLTSSRVVLSTA